MTDIELVLNMLAEVTTTSISKQESPKGIDESKNVARRGGNVAKNARINYEEELGTKVVSKINATSKQLLETKKK